MDHLERRLGLKSVVAISISSMLGSGIFVLPGVAIGETGPSVWLAYLLSSLCVMPAAMSKCELATAMPSSGGTYVYIERTFGPLAGTIAGLSLWFSLLLKSAFALIGISAYLAIVSKISFFGQNFQIPIEGVALSLLFVILLVNLVGVGKVGASILAVVVVSLTGLAAMGVAGGLSIDFSLMEPFNSQGVSGLLAASGLVFVSYAGVTKVAAVAEEIKEPERNLPRGILVSLLIVTFVYVGLSFVLVGNIPYQQLVGDLKPMHTLGESLGGEYVGYGVAFLAILTMASMANSGILAASRFPYAMSRDALIPSIFAKVSRTYLTPWVSICASGVVVVISILSLDVAGIAKLASAVILAIYVIENIAVIVLRETRVQWYSPKFRSPFYPFLQVFGIISGLALFLGMGVTGLKGAAVVVVPALIVYYLYSRSRTSRKGVVGVRVRRKELESPTDGGAFPFQQTIRIRDAKIVIPLFGEERSPECLVEVATALSAGEKLEVVHLTELPEQTDLHALDDALDSPAVRSLERRLKVMSDRTKNDILFEKIPSHDIFKTVYEIGSRGPCKWLVKEWGGRTRGAFTMHNQMGWLEDHLACHVVTFRDAGIRFISKILVLTERGGDLSAVSLRASRNLAAFYGAEIFVGVCIPPAASEHGKERLIKKATMAAKDCGPETNVVPIESMSSLREAILEVSAEFDFLVMRTQSAENLGQRYFGTVQDTIIAKASCSVVCVQEFQG